MGTLVCFHAHPDDEAIATGGSMARAHAEGHRVVLVIATNGEHGESPGDLDADETLADRRRAEVACSASVLGVDRVVWLGYSDSGMTGWEQNEHPASFHLADLDEAGNRLAEVLRAEGADVLTIYDWHGNYGHPDHIKVHRVGVRASELVQAELPQLKVFEATVNRDHIARLFAEAVSEGMQLDPDQEFDPEAPADDGNPFGEPEAVLTHEVDVSGYVGAKRRAIACHASQVSDSSFFLSMPEERFAAAFGVEWFIERGRPPGMRPGWLFEATDSAVPPARMAR
jgi:LmbE family N-acetylglucosaminyl deacetylase